MFNYFIDIIFLLQISKLPSLIECWNKSLECGCLLHVVYFDFHKTFDSMPYKRHLLKLHSYGIQGDLLLWLTNFFDGYIESRKLLIGNNASDWISGVPQGPHAVLEVTIQ